MSFRRAAVVVLPVAALSQLAADFRAIAEKTRGVMVVEADLGAMTSTGSGFAVGDGTTVVTAHHVVDGAHSIRLRLSDDSVVETTTVLALDPERDLALLKVEQPLPVLVVSPDPAPKAGTPVLAIGNPQGLGLAFTDGIVSRLHDDPGGIRIIQHSAPVSPGNSGGPLLDAEGRVVGVNSSALSSDRGQNVNFAVAAEHLRELLAHPEAHPPHRPAPIHAQVEELYGRKLPEAGVCIERPGLGEPFVGDPTPVGVMRGARGCVLIGVVVDGVLRSTEGALAAALPDAAWSRLPTDDRVAALRSWTDAVMLAFDQPTGDAAVTGTGNGPWVVSRRAMRRGDGAGQSEDLGFTFTWSGARELASVDEKVHARWLTTLYVRADKVSGVPEAAVDRALTDHGRVVRQCFTDAWTADLALEGRVRLAWNVTKGKVGTVAVVSEPGTDDDLARCYARAVRSGAYPEGVSGSVTWVFGVDRRQLAGN